MQRRALCRSLRELSDEYLLDEIGVDTAENEPLEVWGENSIQYSLHSLPASPALRDIPIFFLRGRYIEPRFFRAKENAFFSKYALQPTENEICAMLCLNFENRRQQKAERRLAASRLQEASGQRNHHGIDQFVVKSRDGPSVIQKGVGSVTHETSFKR